MQAQFNLNLKPGEKQVPAENQIRITHNVNVCCMCPEPNTEYLVTVRLADGSTISYCPKHAQGRGLS